MRIENFLWDKQNNSISWFYKGRFVKKVIDNLFYVNYHEKEKIIFVKTGKKFHTENIYYFSIEGEEVYKFDKLSGEIKWEYNNKLIEIVYSNVIDARIYFENNLVLLIISNNEKNQKIICYSISGEKLFEKEPPKGYLFRYLSKMGDIPTVVCDGGSDNKDKYGRSEYHFMIDEKNCMLIKGNIMQ